MHQRSRRSLSPMEAPIAPDTEADTVAALKGMLIPFAHSRYVCDGYAAQLAKEKAAREKAEAEVAKMKKNTAVKPIHKIPKPLGTVGKGLKLRSAMRLEGKRQKSLYLACLMTVRDVCLEGGLDWKKGIRSQDPEALGAVYRVARKDQPYLARFENDWATAQILIQYMANRRKNAIRKGLVVVQQDALGRRILVNVKRVPQVDAEEGGDDDDEDLDQGFVDSLENEGNANRTRQRFRKQLGVDLDDDEEDEDVEGELDPVLLRGDGSEDGDGEGDGEEGAGKGNDENDGSEKSSGEEDEDGTEVVAKAHRNRGGAGLGGRAKRARVVEDNDGDETRAPEDDDEDEGEEEVLPAPKKRKLGSVKAA
ncbi:hypothetical protein C8Q76DRAFT_253574 [Earliella scabrosa]|nr:hypothetical protein C8Q76DRAFT_253574 [Earliella scabrosa]